MKSNSLCMRAISGTLFSLLLMGLCAPLPGQKVVGGTLADTLWTVADNPVTVVGNLTIPVGNKLVIGAGVEVQFVANATISVGGGLEIRGTASDPVHIGLAVANPSGGAWKGIRVQSGAAFEMHHTVLSRADLALDLRPSSIPVSITYSVFENNTTGIYTERPMIFLHNLLTNNASAGMVFDGVVPKDSIKNNNLCNYGINIINKRAATVNLTGNGWCSGDTAFILTTLKRHSASSGAILYTPFDTGSINGLVFPGDANYNQVVNMEDLFAIGYAYGDTGAVRPFASTTWIGQQAPDWADSLPTLGTNMKHADCNGDGVVDSFDTEAILLNFMQTHTGGKPQQTDTIPAFSFVVNTTMPYSAGDTIAIPLLLGATNPVLDFYGVAFTIEYDTNMVNMAVPTPVRLQIDSAAWIGTPSVNLLSLQETFEPGKREVGITRTNRVSAAGAGKVADIIVVLSDDIMKRLDTVAFTLTVSNVVAAGEDLVPVQLAGGSATILVAGPTAAAPAVRAEIRILPNPARDWVRVTTSQPGQRVVLLDMAGRQLLAQPMAGNTATVDVRSFAAGTYLLRAETIAGTATQLLRID